MKACLDDADCFQNALRSLPFRSRFSPQAIARIVVHRRDSSSPMLRRLSPATSLEQLEHRRAVWRMIQPLPWTTEACPDASTSSPFDDDEIRDEAAAISTSRIIEHFVKSPL